MSSLPKTGFARKTGTVILGVTVLSSLLLTACSPASQTNDSAPNPTASTASAETPQGVTKFKSEAFDLSKQVSADVKKEDTNIYLAGGVVSSQSSTDSAQSVSFTPYEDKDKAWNYELKKPLDSMRVSPMHWKGKSYLVISGWDNTTKEASGLTAEKKTTVQVTTVLDAVTGAMVVTLNSDPAEVGTAGSNYYLEVSSILDSTSGDVNYVESTFLTGLVFKNGDKYRLVDPTNGVTVTTGERTLSAPMLNSEAGFYQYDNTDYGITPAKPQAKATFGNYVLLATQQPEYQEKTGNYVKNSIYSLVNTVTKQTVGEMKCGDITGMPQETSYSPDFRYVSFFGNYVFDTKTGKSFCTSPVGKEDVRKFYATDVDNNGLMYGFADREYLRISLEDNAKIETLLPDFSSQSELPVRITDKGSALFFSEQSEDTLVSVPAKADTGD